MSSWHLRQAEFTFALEPKLWMMIKGSDLKVGVDAFVDAALRRREDIERCTCWELFRDYDEKGIGQVLDFKKGVEGYKP